MPRILTHSGPLSYRLERLIERERARCRHEDLGRRVEARDVAEDRGEPIRECAKCGIYLLPGELVLCRHCAAGRINRHDTE